MGFKYGLSIAVAMLTAACTAVPERSGPVELEGSRLFSESITSLDDGTLIFGTLVGTIYKSNPGEITAKPWILPDSSATDPASVYGVLADEPAGVLWACAVRRLEDGSRISDLRRYSLKSKELISSYPFPGGGSCNDIAVAPNGDVYASDFSGGRILKLATGDDVLQVWFAGDVGRFRGVDGLVVAPDDSVYVNNFMNGEFYRFFTDAEQKVVFNTLTFTRELERPDGMRLLANGDLLVVEGVGRLAQIKLSADHGIVETLAEGFDAPVSLALEKDIAWVLEGKLYYRSQPERDPGPFRAYPVRFKY